MSVCCGKAAYKLHSSTGWTATYADVTKIKRPQLPLEASFQSRKKRLCRKIKVWHSVT